MQKKKLQKSVHHITKLRERFRKGGDKTYIIFLNPMSVIYIIPTKDKSVVPLMKLQERIHQLLIP